MKILKNFVKITLRNVAPFPHSHHLTTLSITDATCFTKTGRQTKYCSHILHLRLREGHFNIILGFQIGLRLVVAFSIKNTLCWWKRHVGRRTVLKPMLKRRQVALTLLMYTHSSLSSIQLIALIPASSKYQISVAWFFDHSIYYRALWACLDWNL